MITIIPKKFEDKIDIAIEDDVNKLGINFSISRANFDVEDGLEKVLNFIADYVNQNYECLHVKKENGYKVINTNESNKRLSS